MRQGCSLSPLLFALAVGPFLTVVRANPNIKGQTVGTMEQKLSAYADDDLFHLTDPLVSLPMKELQLFGTVSNFKNNYTKSEILPITLPSSLATNLQQAFPFTWANNSLTYLGIKLTDQTDAIHAKFHSFARLHSQGLTGLGQDCFYLDGAHQYY